MVASVETGVLLGLAVVFLAMERRGGPVPAEPDEARTIRRIRNMSDEAKKEETKEQPQDQSELSDEQLEARLHLLRG